MVKLSDEEARRYQRQLIIPDIGEEGQEKLKQARVLVAGAGGLGSPVLMYLAAAGVGTIGIVDSDTVDISNLQRQVLYTVADIGRQKAVAASEKLMLINPGLSVISHPIRLTHENAGGILAGYDLAIDCSDNYPTRYLLSDVTSDSGKPMVYGAVYQFFGQASVFNYKGGPSYRTLFPEELKVSALQGEAPPGVIGFLPGIIGAIETGEALKIILGKGEVLSGKLFQIDAMDFRVEIITI